MPVGLGPWPVPGCGLSYGRSPRCTGPSSVPGSGLGTSLFTVWTCRACPQAPSSWPSSWPAASFLCRRLSSWLRPCVGVGACPGTPPCQSPQASRLQPGAYPPCYRCWSRLFCLRAEFLGPQAFPSSAACLCTGWMPFLPASAIRLLRSDDAQGALLRLPPGHRLLAAAFRRGLAPVPGLLLRPRAPD